MVLQGALSGNHPPQHLPIGTLSGAIDHLLETETGDGWVGQVVLGRWTRDVGRDSCWQLGDTIQL